MEQQVSLLTLLMELVGLQELIPRLEVGYSVLGARLELVERMLLAQVVLQVHVLLFQARPEEQQVQRDLLGLQVQQRMKPLEEALVVE